MDGMCAGHPVTDEQRERLKRLQAALTVIADHQAALQTALDADVRHHLENMLQLSCTGTLCALRGMRGILAACSARHVYRPVCCLVL